MRSLSRTPAKVVKGENGMRCATTNWFTKNGQNDHHKVKHIPRLLEVVPPKCEYFEKTFCREDDDEEEVQSFQNLRVSMPLFVLVWFVLVRPVLVHSHDDHVQRNEQHDYHVELFVGGHMKNDCLQFELKV